MIGIRKIGKWDELLSIDMAKLVRHAMRQFLYLAMESAKEELLKRIPDKPEYQGYRNSLTEVKLGDFFALMVEAPTIRLQDVTTAGVVEVIPVEQPDGTKTLAARILAAQNPWTADTLPGVLPTSEATMIWKRVSPLDLARARQSKQKVLPKVKGMLGKAGAKLLPVEQGEATEDVILQAWRLEFGLLGEPMVKHWRPMVQMLKAQTKALAAKSSQKELSLPSLPSLPQDQLKEMRRWMRRVAK